jgi:poly(A) polymerase
MKDRSDIQAHPAAPEAQQPDSLNLLDLQIKRHQKLEDSQSILARAVKTATSLVWKADDQSLDSLVKLRADLEKNRLAGNSTRIQELEGKVGSAVKADQDALSLRRDINQYGTGFVKSLFLFSKGPVGALGTVTTYGLDQMHSRDSGAAQTVDFVLGGLKGTGMKVAFETLGHSSMGCVAKGAWLGVANTALETGLNREAFLDKATGKYSLNHGLDNIIRTSTDLRARSVDIAVFAGASGLFGLANSASAGALNQSRRLSSLAMGASFGVAGGGSRELMRQREAGEDLDLWKVAKHSFIQGALDMTASAPGSFQTEHGVGRRADGPKQRLASVAEPSARTGESIVNQLRQTESATAGAPKREVSEDSIKQSGAPAPKDKLDEASSGRGYAGYSRTKMEFLVAAKAELPFKNYADFIWRGQGTANLPMRVLNIPEHPGTKIAFVDYEAKNFSRLQALKFLQENGGQIDVTKYKGAARERLEKWIQEAKDADKHPLASRMTPREALAIVRELPDARLLKRLLVVDKAHWEEPWRRQKGEENLKILAEASKDGDVKLYRPPTGEVSRDTIFHEWAHLLKFARPGESALFDMVGELEPIRSDSPADPTIDRDETWAVLVGEGLLNKNFLRAVNAAHCNPIRLTIGAEAVRGVLESVPAEQRSIRHQQYELLLRYIDSNVRPQAQERLVEHLQGFDPSVKQRAATLLGELGAEQHLELLDRLAREASDKTLMATADRAAARLRERLAAATPSEAPGSAGGSPALRSDTTSGARGADGHGGAAQVKGRTEYHRETGAETDGKPVEKEGERPETKFEGDALNKRRREIAVSIVDRLQKAGHMAVFAGGSVRDELLGRMPHDYDVATSATPEQVEALFHRTIPVGKSHGVIRVRIGGVDTEVTTFRTDGEYKDGRRPESVVLLTDPTERSLMMDAARRDLTINAMFRDPITGRLYDFFGGREDLERGVVRAVGDPEHRIFEDRLRMLRALRFAANLGFGLDPALEAAITRHASKIHGSPRTPDMDAHIDKLPSLEKPISGERIREELYKILQSKHVLIGLDGLMRTGLMKEILPEVAEMNTERGEQDPNAHPEGNSWTHTRLVAQLLNQSGAPPEVIMAGLLHDVGKPDTQVRHPDGRITNKNHEEIGSQMVKRIGRRLKFSSDETDRIVHLVQMHMKMHRGTELREANLNRLLGDRHIHDMIALQHADVMGTGRPDRARDSLRQFYLDQLERLTKGVDDTRRIGANRLVTGQTLIDLGLTPSPKFKEILKEAHDAQLEGGIRTPEEGIAWVRRRFIVPKVPG